MRGDSEYAADRAPFAQIATLEADRRDTTIGPKLNEGRGHLLVEHRTGRLSLRDVHGGVVFRLHRADRNAARAAATGWPAVALHHVASLRRGAHLIGCPCERLGQHPIKISRRDGRHGIIRRTWATQGIERIPGDADGGLRLTVERLKVIIVDRPINTRAVLRLELKVVRHET